MSKCINNAIQVCFVCRLIMLIDICTSKQRNYRRIDYLLGHPFAFHTYQRSTQHGKSDRKFDSKIWFENLITWGFSHGMPIVYYLKHNAGQPFKYSSHLLIDILSSCDLIDSASFAIRTITLVDDWFYFYSYCREDLRMYENVKSEGWLGEIKNKIVCYIFIVTSFSNLSDDIV